MGEEVYRIEIVGVDDVKAARYARELRDAILKQSPGAQVRMVSANPETQGAEGEVLHIIAASLGIIYYGLNLWKSQHGDARVKITKDGKEIKEVQVRPPSS